MVDDAPVLSIVPKLAMLIGLTCVDSGCVVSGIVIFSATLRSGSLNLFGAGASDALLMPPPPINDCIASTAGFGLVCLASSAALCCLRLFKSAIAAWPVSGVGDVRGEKPRLFDFGEIPTVVKEDFSEE